MTTKNQDLNLKERFNLFLKNNWFRVQKNIKKRQTIIQNLPNKLTLFKKERMLKNPKWKKYYDWKIDRKGLQTENATTQGLLLWDFIISEKETPGLQQFLLPIAMAGKTDQNVFTRLIAMIYILPSSVWRKILWRYNIDFISKESFLRRLSDDQYNAIEQNFFSWVTNDIPPAVNHTLWDRILVFLGRVNRNTLSEDVKFGHELTKGAWAFNLLGLDFGFSLYPKGKDDDTKITNKSFTRFLSVKEHINDFIVNQYDGKYWKMYKTARSNYVFKPNKEVQLKPHVCPGFWVTLILHAIFWVISPIFFTTVLLKWASIGSPIRLGWIVTLLIAYFPTGLWLTIALFKALGNFLFSDNGIIISIVDWLDEHKKVAKFIKTVFRAIGILIAFCVIILGLWAVGYLLVYFWIDIVAFFVYMFRSFIQIFNDWIYIAEKYLTWGPFLATLLPLTLIASLRYASKSRKMPKGYRITLVTLLVMGGSQIFEKYVDKFLLEAFLIVFYSTVTFVKSNFLQLSILLIGIGMCIYSIRNLSVVKEDEKEYAKHDKRHRYVIYGWVIGVLFLSYRLFSLDELMSFGESLFKMAIIMVTFFAFIFATVLYLLTIRVNSETIDVREEAKRKARIIGYEIDFFSEKERKYIFNLILKNKWLSSLDSDVAYSKMIELKNLLYRVNSSSSYYRPYFLELIPVINEEVYLEIISHKRYIKKFRWEKCEKLLGLIMKGFKYSEAVQLYKKQEKLMQLKLEARKRRIEKFNQFCRIYIANPLLFLWKWTGGLLVKLIVAIWHCFVWVWRQILTLKDLWRLFNERCPFIAKTETIK